MTTLHITVPTPSVDNTQPVNCGNPTLYAYPLLTLVPAIFSLCSLSYQSAPFQTLPLSPRFISLLRLVGASDTCVSTCSQGQVLGACPEAFLIFSPASSSDITSRDLQYLPKWLSYYNFQVLTPTQNIPFCSQALQWQEVHCRDDSHGQCHSRAHQPTKLCLFAVPLHADHCQQSCLINTSHLTPIPQEVLKFTSLSGPFSFIDKLCHQVWTSF